MSNDDRPINRRRFFREGLRELLKPLAGAMEPLTRAADQLAALDRPAYTPPPPAPPPPRPETYWLRPPGALGESEFLSICSRCQECLRVCPAACIQIDMMGEQGNGAPYIDPDAMACTVCEGVDCSTHCPSGALQPVGRLNIRIGTAVWREEMCARTMGQECSICVDHCPLGAQAIQITEGRIDVIASGCVGCGVCQHDCPTSPKSITVRSRSAIESGQTW